MTEQSGLDDTSDPQDEAPQVPRHLAALVGALNGPSDLGRHHDRYLAYPDREETGGAASA